MKKNDPGLQKPRIILHRAEDMETLDYSIRELGVDGAEIDVRKAPDGNFYLAHDLPDWEDAEALAKVTQLGDVFDFLKAYPESRLNCDMKDTKDMPGIIEMARNKDVEKQLYFTGGMRIDFISQNRSLLEAVDVFINLEVLTGKKDMSLEEAKNEIYKLKDKECVKALAEQCKQAGITGLNVNYNFVTEELIEAFHAIKLAISAWTVDELFDIERMLACGVDYITTNIPVEALEKRELYIKKNKEEARQ